MISVSFLFWLDISFEPHMVIAEDSSFQVRTDIPNNSFETPHVFKKTWY